jgi:hypothetical protein
VKRKRPKLPGRIVGTADTLKQLHLAVHGKQLSLLEELAGKYLSFQRPLPPTALEDIAHEHLSSEWPDNSKVMEEILSPEAWAATKRNTVQALCGEFLRILAARDWNALKQLAKSGPKLLDASGDRISAGILVWKLSGQMAKCKPSFDWEIAEAIGYKGNPQVFARRLRVLGCPYKVERGGRGHKRADRSPRRKSVKS